MAIDLDPKQVVSFEEFLMSQVVQREALTRLLGERGIFTIKLETLLYNLHLNEVGRPWNADGHPGDDDDPISR
jgi:hypothetical protein